MKNVFLITGSPEWFAPFLEDNDDWLSRSGIRIPLVIHVFPSMKWADRVRDLGHCLRNRARINNISFPSQAMAHLAWRLRYGGQSVQATPSAVAAMNRDRKVVRVVSANHPDAIDAVRRGGFDLGVIMGSDILRRETLSRMAVPLLNIHLGDPSFVRGTVPFLWEILDSRKKARITLQRVAPILDAGDIVLQRDLPIDWGSSLHETLRQTTRSAPRQVAELLRAGLPPVLDGTAEYLAVEPGPLRTVPPWGTLIAADRMCKHHFRHRQI